MAIFISYVSLPEGNSSRWDWPPAPSQPHLQQPPHRWRPRRPTGRPGDDQGRRAAQPAETFHETQVLRMRIMGKWRFIAGKTLGKP
jgi:hypothetical protein